MDDLFSLGQWIKRRRKACDLTQDALAQRVGCSLETIRKIEADARRPSRQIAERLADQLGVAAEERLAFLQAARAELATDQLAPPTRTVPQPTLVPPAALPRGTLTFLFSDIEGSTRLWERYPQAMAASLARHDTILRQQIEVHGGAVFKTVGDAFCAAFASPQDALAAALAVQRALAPESWGATGPLHVRIAIQSGSAEQRAGDYFGPTLNRVARLLSTAHGGQILLALASAELVRDHLPPDVTLRDLGLHHLKDLTRAEQIFQVVAADLPSDFPLLRSLDARRHNLPAQPTALIGREQELARIGQLLRRADVRLVTLTGPGGTGKTRLALQVAAELLDAFRQGVWFVNLAPLSNPALVLPTIAQTLGVRERGDQPLQATLHAFLRDQQLLLLLDNFEQVSDAALEVAGLLAAAPGLTVLVASRTVLRLAGEHEVAVPPLGLPARAGVVPVERLTQYDAVRLFIERARAVKADFAVTNDNAPAVAEICYRLDGLPLAIELAAARVKLFAPAALLARLNNRLAFLTGGARDLPARQQTIRATINWSYNLLAEGEQQLFARLSVFVGGFTLEAVEAVCNASGDLPMAVIDAVATLVDQSLLQQTEGMDDEPRLVMLETIREYALERLEASGLADAIRRQHAHFFLALAEEAEPKLYGTEQRAWLDRLGAEHDNLRAALTWSHIAGEAELGLRLAAALGRFWYVLGWFGEGRRWLEGGLAQASAASPIVRARALSWAGTFASGQSDMATAYALFESSIALFRAAGDTQRLVNALGGLGWMAFDQGNYPLAQASAEEGVGICREVGDKQGLAVALTLYAYIADGLGDETAARASAEESLALFQEIGDNWNLAGPLSILGNLARRQGDYVTARARYEEGLALWRETGDKVGMAWGLRNLGAVARAQGEAAWAAALFAESLVIEQELGYKPYTAQCLEGLAWVAGARGQSEQAARLLGAAEALRSASGACIPPVDRADYDGVVAATRPQLDDATFATAWAAGRALMLEQAIAEALRVADQLGHTPGTPRAEHAR